MEIYLDIVYLFNVYIGMLCILSLSIIFNQRFSFKKILGISFLFGLDSLCLYIPYSHVFFFFWVMLVSYVLVKKHFFKTILCLMFLYFTYTTSFFLLSKDIYFRGPILIVTTSFTWLYVLVIGTIVILLYMLMLFNLKKEVLRSGLYYKVLIVFNQTTLVLDGFLDTGNEAVHQGLPILFTSTIPIKKDTDVEIQRVYGKEICPAMKVNIYFQEQWKEAYLARLDDMDLKDADILLNLNLF